MADALKAEMRLTDLTNNWNGNMSGAVRTIFENGKNPKIIHLLIEGTRDGTTYGELHAPDNQLNETTAVQLWLRSASANDKDAADGHLRKVTIIGVSDGDQIVAVEEPLDSTDGTTAVQTTSLWKRVFHMYGSTFGSGGDDAAGAITLTDDAVGTTTYLTIRINEVESNGTSVVCPSGCKVKRVYSNAALTSFTNIGYGVNLRLNLIGDIAGNDPDIWHDTPHHLTSYKGVSIKRDDFHDFGSGGRIYPMGKYMTGAESFSWHVDYVVYND